jgi:rubrerythrin
VNNAAIIAIVVFVLLIAVWVIIPTVIKKKHAAKAEREKNINSPTKPTIADAQADQMYAWHCPSCGEINYETNNPDLIICNCGHCGQHARVIVQEKK